MKQVLMRTDEIAETVVDAGRGHLFGIHRPEHCGRRRGSGRGPLGTSRAYRQYS